MNMMTRIVIPILIILNFIAVIGYGYYNPYKEYKDFDQLVNDCNDNIRENAQNDTTNPELAQLILIIDSNKSLEPLSGEASDIIQMLLDNKKYKFRYFYILPYLIKIGNISSISDLPQHKLLNIWGTWALDLAGKISHQDARENIIRLITEMNQSHQKGVDLYSLEADPFVYCMYRALPYIMENPFDKSRELILYLLNNPDLDLESHKFIFKHVMSEEIIRFARNAYGDKIDLIYLGFLETTPDNINSFIKHSGTYQGDYTHLVKLFTESYIFNKEDKIKRVETLKIIMEKWKSNISQFDDVSNLSFEKIRKEWLEQYTKGKKTGFAEDYGKHRRVWAREQFIKGSEILESIIKENENKE